MRRTMSFHVAAISPPPPKRWFRPEGRDARTVEIAWLAPPAVTTPETASYIVPLAVAGRHPRDCAELPTGSIKQVRVGIYPVAGNHTSTRQPCPSLLLRRTVPPDCLAMPYTCDSPSPVPLPISLVVKKGSKARSITFWLIATPVSVTASTAYRPGRKSSTRSPGCKS